MQFFLSALFTIQLMVLKIRYINPFNPFSGVTPSFNSAVIFAADVFICYWIDFASTLILFQPRIMCNEK